MQMESASWRSGFQKGEKLLECVACRLRYSNRRCENPLRMRHFDTFSKVHADERDIAIG